MLDFVYIYNNIIIHKNIKPENVSMNQKYNVKLSDFLLQKCYKPSQIVILIIKVQL